MDGVVNIPKVVTTISMPIKVFVALNDGVLSGGSSRPNLKAVHSVDEDFRFVDIRTEVSSVASNH